MKYIQLTDELRKFLEDYVGYTIQNVFRYAAVDNSTGSVNLVSTVVIPDGDQEIKFSEFIESLIKTGVNLYSGLDRVCEGLSRSDLTKLLDDKYSSPQFIPEYADDFIISMSYKPDKLQMDVMRLMCLFNNSITNGDFSKSTLVFYRRKRSFKLSTWNAPVYVISSKSEWNKVRVNKVDTDIDFINLASSNCSYISEPLKRLMTNLMVLRKLIDYNIVSKITKYIYENYKKFDFLKNEVLKSEEHGNCIDRLQEQNAEVRTGTEPAGSILYGRKGIASVAVGPLSYTART